MIQSESKPLVSIITPSYNQGEFIRETIESVLGQDYPNIEYIVMDGGSTDETVDILKSYGERICWVSEKDDGQADAVNKGVQRARGGIIGWLNSDDTYYEGAVSAAVEYLTAHPEADLVYGEANFVHRDGSLMGQYGTEPYSRDRMATTCLICQPSAFFRKSAFEAVGMLDKRLQCCMDYELWMRMAAQSHVLAHIPRYMATSRMYDENKTTARYQEMCDEVFACLTKYYGYVHLDWIKRYARYRTGRDGGRRYRLAVLRYLFSLNRPGYALSTLAKHMAQRE